MADRTRTPAGIDEYIAARHPSIQPILKKIRATIAAAALRLSAGRWAATRFTPLSIQRVSFDY